jgi:hypothetical protein
MWFLALKIKEKMESFCGDKSRENHLFMIYFSEIL